MPSVELERGLEAIGLALPADARAKLLDYLALIDKWNRVYNLTAVREVDKMLTQHVLDSLAVVPHLRGQTILDVGSGAGLPGIPVALARPAWRVTLLESNHKKASFLKQAAIDLKLGNAQAVQARVEAWDAPRRFDVVISRAFADLAQFVNLAGAHCAPGGMIAAMKGVHPYEEIAQVPPPYRVAEVVALKVPGLDAERHLVVIERA